VIQFCVDFCDKNEVRKMCRFRLNASEKGKKNICFLKVVKSKFLFVYFTFEKR